MSVKMGGHITQRPWTPTKRRGPIAAEFAGPGPAWVALPTTIGLRPNACGKSSSPRYSIGSRHKDTRDHAGPGPGRYNVVGLYSDGKASSPSATMHIRHAEPKRFVTPAPGAYCPEKGEPKTMDASPKYSFGVKTSPELKSNTPAPNAYNVNSTLTRCPEATKKNSPCYTMTGRRRDAMDPRVANPGPGKYDSGNIDAVKQKAPNYSLSMRTVLPTDDTKKPGPGAYSPEKVQIDLAPNYSFGIKHSPYIAELKRTW